MKSNVAQKVDFPHHRWRDDRVQPLSVDPVLAAGAQFAATGRTKPYNENVSHFKNVSPMRLSELPKGAAALVESVQDVDNADAIAQRLRDLGFVPGEPVRVVAAGPWGADPILIQIGSTRFALRRAEANRVNVREADRS